MAGNVWEWTSDWYGIRHEGEVDVAPCCAPRNPRGPAVETSYDPRQPQFRVPRKVIKGGSFLCADSYCLRPASAQAADDRQRYDHIGAARQRLTRDGPVQCLKQTMRTAPTAAPREDKDCGLRPTPP